MTAGEEKYGKLPVAKRPHVRAGLQVRAEKLIFVMAKVGPPVGQRHGRRDRRANFVASRLRSVGQRNDVQEAVAAAKHRLPVGHGGRAVDIIGRFVHPVALARGGGEAVQFEIVAADQHVGLAAGDKPIGRAEDFVAGGVFPKLFAGGGVQRVQVGIARADEDFSVQHERRGFNRVAVGEGPDFLAGRKVERVQVAIVRTDEDAIPDDGGRGFDGPGGLEGPEQRGFFRELSGRDAGERRLRRETSASPPPVRW